MTARTAPAPAAIVPTFAPSLAPAIGLSCPPHELHPFDVVHLPGARPVCVAGVERMEGTARVHYYASEDGAMAHEDVPAARFLALVARAGAAPRRRGRPPVGVRVDVRLPADVIDAADDEAARTGRTRADVLRAWIVAGLAAS